MFRQLSTCATYSEPIYRKLVMDLSTIDSPTRIRLWLTFFEAL
jgi:hypothetical protein